MKTKRGVRMQTSTQDSQSNRSPRIRKDVLQTVILLFLVVIISGGVGYFGGYQMGKKEGARLAVKKVTDFINPLNAIADSKLFPGTVVGKVTDIKSGSIKVKQTSGKEKSVAITNTTKVTKDSKTVNVSDIKKDSNVTVLTNNQGSDQVATRIIIR